MVRSRGVLEDRLRTEARIFAAGRPGEVAKRLEALRAMDDVTIRTVSPSALTSAST
jgi:hypothetical protein